MPQRRLAGAAVWAAVIRLFVLVPLVGTLLTCGPGHTGEPATTPTTAGGNTLRVELLRQEYETSNVEGVAWSPDGKFILTGTTDKAVALWAADATAWAEARARPVFRNLDHTGFVSAVAWAPNQRHFLTAAADGSVRIWDAAGRTVVQTFDAKSYRYPAAGWSPGGALLALALGEEMVELRAWPGGALVRQLPVKGETTALAWSPDSRQVAVGARDGAVVVWQAPTGTVSKSLLHAGRRDVNTLAWSPDGRSLAVGFNDGSLLLYETANWMQRTLARGKSVNSVAWSPNAQVLVSTSTKFDVTFWDTTTGVQLAYLDVGYDTNAAAWSPDGRYVAVGTDDHTLKIWQVAPPQSSSDPSARLFISIQPGYMAR